MDPSPEFEVPDGTLLGRIVLLVGAYSPVLLIVGLRTLPGWVGITVTTLALLSAVSWAFFLAKVLPSTGAHRGQVDEAEFVDSEVTGYVVSILLPVVAAPPPTPYDGAAYFVCAVLVLYVAFVARLWIVNPVAYLFGYRAASVTLNGERRLMLLKTLPVSGSTCMITGALGVFTAHPRERSA